MCAANDTAAPTTIARGTTYESAAWRAHRYDDHVVITSLANAGKRGKSCEVFVVHGANEALEPVAPFIFSAVDGCVSVDTMGAVLADVALAGLRLSRRSMRGVDVDAEPVIRLETDLVSATFSPRETLVRFTAIMGRPGNGGTFRHDTIVGSDNRASARKAYAWAKANGRAVLGMNVSQFRDEMYKIGVRLS